jgi:Fic family protein
LGNSSSRKQQKNKQLYSPPYEITLVIVNLVEQIGESLGRISPAGYTPPTAQLRRETRIKSVQASLNIEGNTLSLEQVTAVLDGKRVLGTPREIQEIRNAFAAYDLPDFQRRLKKLLLGTSPTPVN